MTNAGNLPGADRRDPDQVIGEPEYGDVPGTFFTLGFGGEMIVKFPAPLINGPGDDLFIVETSYGNQTCDTYPEKVDVWVAQYINESLYTPVQEELDVLELDNWIYMGQGCLDYVFELGDLPWIKYVYMKDVSDPNDFSNSQTSDGYDINGLVALHGTAGVTADIISSVSGGVEPYTYLWSTGDTTANLYGVGEGTYSLMVTDANDCVIEASILVECDEEDKEEYSPLTHGNPLNAGDDKISIVAYPNPFTRVANIEFELEQDAPVTIDLYNMTGERVDILFEGYVNANTVTKVRFDASSLPNGIYFYRVNVDRKTFLNKLILAR